MVRRTQKLDGTIQQNFEAMRADYAGAKDSRWTRKRDSVNGFGRSGDWHISKQTHYLRMMERARSMDRDDIALGQTVDRAVSHTIQGGFAPDPKTGEKSIDKEWKARWEEYAGDPELCDLAGEMEFAEIEDKVFRATLVDGDHFVLPYLDGQLEMVEGHRCQSSKGTKRAINGIVMDDNRRRLEYWFTKNDVDPMGTPRAMSEITARAARDADGYRNVFHVYNSKRVSLTRGMTAFTPLFDFAGMFEDTMFAGVLKQQIAACFVIFRKRAASYRGKPTPAPVGSARQEEQADGSVRHIQELAPGMEIVGENGEELSGFNPPAIGGEFLPILKMVLALLGVNFGLPLVMVLMDGSETNFSGYRGAIDQARMGFRSNQRMLVRKLHRPVWNFQVRRWLLEDGAARGLWAKEQEKPKELRKFDPFRNRWNLPAWDYIEPLKDATADALKYEKGLTSMRRIHAARGMDIDEIWSERIGDTMNLFSRAQRAADRWNKKYPHEPMTMWKVLQSAFGTSVSELATQLIGQEDSPQQNQKSGASEK
jgi:capsid protein